MLDDVRDKLEAEVDELLHELNVVLPGEIERAAGLGDLRENSEYASALERQRFVRARLDYVTRRLSELAQLTLDHIPTDRIGFGSRVRVRDADSGEVEEYILAFGDDLDFDNSEISMRSPIGRALLGKRPGEVVSVMLPAAEVTFEILELITVHELLDGGPPSPSPDGDGG